MPNWGHWEHFPGRTIMKTSRVEEGRRECNKPQSHLALYKLWLQQLSREARDYSTISTFCPLFKPLSFSFFFYLFLFIYFVILIYVYFICIVFSLLVCLGTTCMLCLQGQKGKIHLELSCHVNVSTQTQPSNPLESSHVLNCWPIFQAPFLLLISGLNLY